MIYDHVAEEFAPSLKLAPLRGPHMRRIDNCRDTMPATAPTSLEEPVAPGSIYGCPEVTLGSRRSLSHGMDLLSWETAIWPNGLP